jgi:hypothetical protein
VLIVADRGFPIYSLFTIWKSMRHRVRLSVKPKETCRHPRGLMKEAAQPDVLPVELERAYTPAELAPVFGCSIWTIRRLLKDTPGVLRRHVGGRIYLAIPARVLAGLHRRLTEK